MGLLHKAVYIGMEFMVCGRQNGCVTGPCVMSLEALCTITRRLCVHLGVGAWVVGSRFSLLPPGG